MTNKRSVTVKVTTLEHENGTVEIWIKDTRGELVTHKTKEGILAAAEEIGSAIWEEIEADGWNVDGGD